MPPSATIIGIDFTSAPRRAKPITIAVGCMKGGQFGVAEIRLANSFEAFEATLRAPGPWIAGIDAPFSLPREAVRDLGWPDTWPALVRHCSSLGKAAFRAALDAYRESRPHGSRYAHRATDAPAGSHSPLKLVNPPVGLMYLEAAPRLLDAGVTVPMLHAGSPERIALEAYPGYTARMLVRGSYKSDEKAKQTPDREAARRAIVATLRRPDNPLAIALTGSRALLESLVSDASGDRLDAVLAAMQAAWSHARRHDHYGLPRDTDPLEGWIATVPRPAP